MDCWSFETFPYGEEGKYSFGGSSSVGDGSSKFQSRFPALGPSPFYTVLLRVFKKNREPLYVPVRGERMRLLLLLLFALGGKRGGGGGEGII